MNEQIEKRIEKFSRQGSKPKQMPLIAMQPYTAERAARKPELAGMPLKIVRKRTYSYVDHDPIMTDKHLNINQYLYHPNMA